MKRGDRVLLTTDGRQYTFVEYEEPLVEGISPRLAVLQSRFSGGSSFKVRACDVTPVLWDDERGAFYVDRPLVN